MCWTRPDQTLIRSARRRVHRASAAEDSASETRKTDERLRLLPQSADGRAHLTVCDGFESGAEPEPRLTRTTLNPNHTETEPHRTRTVRPHPNESPDLLSRTTLSLEPQPSESLLLSPAARCPDESVPRQAADVSCETGQLVSRAVAGDDGALLMLIRRHQRLAIATARPLSRDYHDACDAAQNGLILAVQRLSSLRSPSQFAGWLAVIVRNEAKRQKRSEARRQKHERTASRNATAAATQWVTQRPTCPDDELLLAVGKLPDAERIAVVLHYFESQTAGEIAAMAGTSAGTITKRLSRAVVRLRRLLPAERQPINPPSLTGAPDER